MVLQKVAFLFDKNNDWIYKYFDKHLFDFKGYSIKSFFDESFIFSV